MKEWMTESRRVESPIPAFPDGIRNSEYKNSLENTSSDTVQLPLPRLDLLKSDFSETGRKARLQNHCVQMILHWNLMHKMHNAHHMYQGHASQHMRTLGSQPSHLVIFFVKTQLHLDQWITSWQMLNFELYTYFIVF